MKMKLADWARFYGVHPKTAYRWYREGIMPFPVEKISERVIVVDVPDVVSAAGEVVVYARVSSYDQGAGLVE